MQHSAKHTGGDLTIDLYRNYKRSTIMIGAGGIVMQIAHTVAALPTVVPVAAINDNPAIGALAYDCLLGLLSLAVWNMT